MDVLVIGGGPGGYVAAIRAAQLGAKTCVVEMDKVGGTCLNRGCIPTKALYRNAEIINNIKEADMFGITIPSFDLDFTKVQERKGGIVNTLVSGIDQLLKANGVELISGKASLKDKNTVTVNLNNGETREITAKNIIIATGSRPSMPSIEGGNLEGVLTSDEILELSEVPKRLLVVGGGVIGMEFASIFNSLGSEVTVLQSSDRILKFADTDLTKRLIASSKKKGIAMNLNTRIQSISKENDSLKVIANGKKGEVSFEADKVLLSIGRVPVVEGLGLENVGIEFDNKGIKVDANFETNIKGIYAIGDVNGKHMLAHAASHQGISVAEIITGLVSHADHNLVPNCVFVFPELSTIGPSEDELKAEGKEYKVSKFMFGANGKALTLGESEGLVKILADMDNNILGVHILGPHASDLIHEGVLAVSNKLNVEDIANTIHAHPTLSESFVEAVLGIDNKAIHMAPLRK
ncbi:MAG: dihydrolipoyl dehydrogenase [Clostridium sp.]